MADYLLYDVDVSLLSPLHIGSGQTLLHEYDYVVHGRKTWRINERTLLDAAITDDLSIAAQLARTKPAELLKPSDFQPGSPLFRYIIDGVPRSRAEGAELNEQIKDSYDRPYLPGTSLKGALRTALAWHAWGENGLQPDADRLGRSRKFADSSYTRELFGQ
ncbi:MAG: type III-A CRISPR-associated RAMP protein Csm5, partial [Candidatus Promineifilaceae bacterium]